MDKLYVFLFFFFFRFKVYTNFIPTYVLLITAMEYLFLSIEMLWAVRVTINQILGPFQVKVKKNSTEMFKEKLEIYIK